MNEQYDVIVIGAGHAGCEAASAAARMGSKTLLITMDMNKIAQMSCNPAVGGIAKGQIVREIDALGGKMGIITDETALQFRMLNRSKGPAMWSPRAQSDRMKFSLRWRHELEHTENLDMWQDTVTELRLEGGEATGVKTQTGATFGARAVVITSGTFLNGLMHIGRVKIGGGRCAEPSATGLTEQLKAAGIATGRMKTGTPVRIDGRSVDYSRLAEQKGEEDFHRFSYLKSKQRALEQRSCYMAYTNPRVHEILREGLPDSPLYNGQIQSIGPRYCPSIETKIVTFADKEQHHLFLEPEGEDSTEMYLNGFSSSLPLDIQLRALHQIEGLENAKIYRPGYAIEYDYFDPTELNHALESKKIGRLFFAGQVNGTTGYEEAAGQGLLAGINAHLRAHGEAAFTLGRDEAYIGVLVDDLVTKGVDEPYRMFTSRAEHRILLRQDNADERLTEKGYHIGTVGTERYETLKKKLQERDELIGYIREESVRMEEINPYLAAIGTTELKQGCRIGDLLLRPQISLGDLGEQLPRLKERMERVSDYRDEVWESAEIMLKYEGYIERENAAAEKLRRLEDIRIKGKIDYANLKALSTESRQKLVKIDPETIGQASRIPGISPSDISILLVFVGR